FIISATVDIHSILRLLVWCEVSGNRLRFLFELLTWKLFYLETWKFSTWCASWRVEKPQGSR
ncbi:hypothetical protein EUTSA_v10006440mg, partial [Eutrema salsugineum]